MSLQSISKASAIHTQYKVIERETEETFEIMYGIQCVICYESKFPYNFITKILMFAITLTKQKSVNLTH